MAQAHQKVAGSLPAVDKAATLPRKLDEGMTRRALLKLAIISLETISKRQNSGQI